MLIQTLDDGRRLFDHDGLVDYIESFLGDQSLEYEKDPVAKATVAYTQKWLRETNFNESTNMDGLLGLYIMIFGHGVTTDDDEYFYSEAPEDDVVEDRRLQSE